MDRCRTRRHRPSRWHAEVLATGHADTVDPILTQNLYPILSLSYDGLTADQRVSGSGSVQLVPDLAVSLPAPTEGGTTYTFQLRRGIRYSNGDLLRPEDFRRGLERGLILGGNTGTVRTDPCSPKSSAVRPGRLTRVIAMIPRRRHQRPPADTVTFHLLAPDPEFLDRLTLPDAYPVPPGIPTTTSGFAPCPPRVRTNGYFSSKRIPQALVRNPYFRELVTRGASLWLSRPDRLSRKRRLGGRAVERGTADYMFDGVPPDRMAEVVAIRRPAVHQPVWLDHGADPQHADGAVHRRQVRRAINYAVDRAEVRSAPRRGTPSPPVRSCPSAFPGYRRYCPYTIDPGSAGTWSGPNLARAMHLIGASRTRETPITIGTSTNKTLRRSITISSRSSVGSATRPRSRTSPISTRPARRASPIHGRAFRPPSNRSPSAPCSPPPRRSSRTDSPA